MRRIVPKHQFVWLVRNDETFIALVPDFGEFEITRISGTRRWMARHNLVLVRMNTGAWQFADPDSAKLACLEYYNRTVGGIG
jgi:hypothetical protein